MPQRILASLKSLVNKRNFNFHCISAPNHPGKGLDPPQNQAKSDQKNCPKPSGQESRPPSPYGQCPNAPCMNLSGASLSSQSMGWVCFSHIGGLFHSCWPSISWRQDTVSKGLGGGWSQTRVQSKTPGLGFSSAQNSI